MGTGERTTIVQGGHEVGVYVSRPEGRGPWPGVVVLHEAWGLNGDIERIADRFAANGYLTVAPDLIGGGLRCLVRTFRELYAGAGGAVDRGRAVIEWTARHDEVADRRLGVAGFCLGGGFALLLGTEDAVTAVAPAYGRVPPDDHVARLCPVVGSYGARDRMFAPQGRRLRTTLAAAGIEHEVEIYPGAGHSFMNREAPWFVTLFGPLTGVGYQHVAAEDAWGRILTFFDRHV